jgi:hypothetical protein
MLTKLLLSSPPKGLRTNPKVVEMHSFQEAHRTEDGLPSITQGLETARGICWGILSGSLLWLAIFGLFWMLW